MTKLYPGDQVRDSLLKAAEVRTIMKVADGLCHFSHGPALSLEQCVLVKRGEGAALMKAREGDGRFTDRKFQGGDQVKVTGPVPNKGKIGKVTMISGDGHVVTHDDGSHASYPESHLSHANA